MDLYFYLLTYLLKTTLYLYTELKYNMKPLPFVRDMLMKYLS